LSKHSETQFPVHAAVVVVVLVVDVEVLVPAHGVQATSHDACPSKGGSKHGQLAAQGLETELQLVVPVSHCHLQDPAQPLAVVVVVLVADV
jgi:hypothetical protein